MKKLKLTDIAPYSGKRVHPFDGVKRYMSTGDLKGDNLSFEDVTYETKPSRADIIVSEGDILFAKMTNTNKALQIDNVHAGIIVSTGFSVHRPLENKLFGEYFLHFLKHNSFQRQKNKLCTGAIQSAISNNGIEKIFVPVPDFEDQIHIANLLCKAENLISQRKESIRLLDEFLKSMFLEMFGDPVRNEKGWRKDKVISYTDCIVPGRDKPKSFTGYTPWFTTEDLKHKGYVIKSKKGLGLSEEEIKEVRARVIPAGSVLMTCVGDLGILSVCKEECVVNQQLHAFICGKEINNLFLMYSLSFRTQFMYKNATSTTVPYMNKITCNSIPVIIPPIELQTQFAQIVEKTEALKTQYQQSLQELENLYGSLSQKAFKGELSVKDQQV
jgi:type I restriction enzyme S subunit